MKNSWKNALLVSGALVAAYLLFKPSTASSPGGGGGSDSQDDSKKKDDSSPTPSIPAIIGPILDPSITSLDLSQRSAGAIDRFVVVQYPGASSPGVLDRFQQQSITLQEAIKRQNNPFAGNQAVPYSPNSKVSMPENKGYSPAAAAINQSMLNASSSIFSSAKASMPENKSVSTAIKKSVILQSVSPGAKKYF